MDTRSSDYTSQRVEVAGFKAHGSGVLMVWIRGRVGSALVPGTKMPYANAEQELGLNN